MKQEVRRGRKFVEYHDPETQDEFTFTQEISGADVSYQETDGSWHPADENWATDGVDGFVLKNDKLNHKIRLKGNGGRAWYPRRNVNTEYMTFGVPQYWNGKRWTNFRFSGWSVEGKTITLQTRQGVTILVHSRWNGIKIDWVLASSSAPSRMRYPVSLTGITYVDGIIYGADGTRLGQLTPTTATDVNGAELVCSGSFASGYVEFQADVTGASFPVTIDPDFSSVDGGDTVVGSARATWNFGARSDTYGVINRDYKLLMRFILSSIDSANVCTAVDLKITKITGSSSNSQTLYVHELTNGNGDWIEGTKTGAVAGSGEPCWNAKVADGSGGVTTAWAGSVGLGTSGTDYIATAYSSITHDRADAQYTQYTFSFNETGITAVQGWFGDATNNGIILFGNNVYGVNFATSENATEAYRPVLTVTYTAGATGALRRTNMNAQMQSLTGGFN